MNKLITDGIIFDVDGTLWDTTPLVARAWNRVMDRFDERHRAQHLPPLHLVHPKGGGNGLRLEADDLRREFGKPLEVIIDDLIPDLPSAEKESLLQSWYASEEAELDKYPPTPYTGLETVLQNLTGLKPDHTWADSDKRCRASRTLPPGIPCFIVSNCQGGYIEQFLRTTGYGPYITDHLCPGDNHQLKAFNIYDIASRYHLQNAVYVGDIQADCDAVREADQLLKRHYQDSCQKDSQISGNSGSPSVRFIWASYGFSCVKEPDEVLTKICDLPDLITAHR
ncbi:MAG: HAD hydrolase-like protein [Eubacterium sp.]|nr:HAD hydrolase-like protein [Eubacterium sp.]